MATGVSPTTSCPTSSGAGTAQPTALTPLTEKQNIQSSPRTYGATRTEGASSPWSTPLPSSLRLYATSFTLRGLRRSYVHRRLPCNRNVWLVYLLFFLQGLAEFSALLYLFFALDAYQPLNPPQTVAVYLLARCLVLTASPVAGFLADAFFGRYKVIKASLYMCLAGAAIMSVGFSTSALDPFLSDTDQYARLDLAGTSKWPHGSTAFVGVAYAVLLVGFTGVQVNLIPFGVDQLPGASGGELSSYFHCSFWCFTAGKLVGATAVPYIYQEYSLAMFFLLLAVCYTGEILILVLRRHDGFVIQPLLGNHIKLVYRVLKSAFHAKKPVYRSAFDVGRSPPSRIDRAMDINGGKFTVEQVEDVKTVLRILAILLSFFGLYSVSSQLVTTYLLEGIRMTVPHGTYTDCTIGLQESTQFFQNLTYSIECHKWTIPPSILIVVATFVPILMLIPLVDRLLYVSCQPKMLKRIAAGKLFLLLSILVAIAVEVVRMEQMWAQFGGGGNITVVINAIPFHTESATSFHLASPLSIFYIMPQYVLFAFTEVLANITVLEFIYAQSPGAMKGLLLGMLFLTNGMGMGLSSLLIYLQSYAKQFNHLSYFGNSEFNVVDSLKCFTKSQSRHGCVDGPLFSYLVLTAVVLVSGAVFLRAAYKYTLRRRGLEPFNPHL